MLALLGLGWLVQGGVRIYKYESPPDRRLEYRGPEATPRSSRTVSASVANRNLGGHLDGFIKGRVMPGPR